MNLLGATKFVDQTEVRAKLYFDDFFKIIRGQIGITVLTPGLLHSAIFCQIFEKIRMLHFFDIFCNSPGVTTVHQIAF